MERKQFTFYRSFYDAVRQIRKKSARADAYDAICAYALHGQMPDLEKMEQGVAVALTLIMPVLESSNRKAANRMKTDENKLNQTKTNENKLKQTENKKENEIEIEKELEIELESECESESDRLSGEGAQQRDFDLFWQAYPKKVGKNEARRAFAKVSQPVEMLVDAVKRQKDSEQWSRDNGRFIPNPATWLSQQRWEDQLPAAKGVPKGASGRLGKAELENIQRMLNAECKMQNAK